MKKSKIIGILAIFTLLLVFTGIGVNAEAEAVAVETASELDFGEWIQSYLTAEHVTIVLQALAIIGVVFKAVNQTKTLANTHVITMKNISSTVESVVKEVSSKEFTEKVNAQLAPTMKTIEELKKLISTQTKMLALMQDNSPEAKIAVTSMLYSLGNEDMTETASKVKDSIVTEIKAVETKKQAKNDKLQSIKEDNEATVIF